MLGSFWNCREFYSDYIPLLFSLALFYLLLCEWHCQQLLLLDISSISIWFELKFLLACIWYNCVSFYVFFCNSCVERFLFYSNGNPFSDYIFDWQIMVLTNLLHNCLSFEKALKYWDYYNMFKTTVCDL